MDLSEHRHFEALIAEQDLARKVQRAALLPRFIRHRDAPAYLGVDRNKFDAEIRPLLTEIPLGARSVAFDRLDLDAWADDYKIRNGRSSRKIGKKLSCVQEQKVSLSPKTGSVPSTKNTKGGVSSPGLAPSAKKLQKFGSGKDSSKSMSRADRLLLAISEMRRKPM